MVEGDVSVFLYLQVIEDDRSSSDDISTNGDDDMFQSILQTLFSTSGPSLPVQPSPPTIVGTAAESSSGYGRYKKDIRNCIDDHDNDDGDTTPPAVVDEGKHSTTTINDDTTIAPTSTLPPPRRRRYIKKPKKRTTTSDSLMLMSNINLIM